MSSNPLIGTWRLLSWENTDANGHTSYPLGEDAVGYIIYTPWEFRVASIQYL